jgi:hypothetical protein
MEKRVMLKFDLKDVGCAVIDWVKLAKARSSRGQLST